MGQLPASAGHGALLTEKIPSLEERKVFVRFILSLVQSRGSLAASTVLRPSPPPFSSERTPEKGFGKLGEEPLDGDELEDILENTIERVSRQESASAKHGEPNEEGAIVEETLKTFMRKDEDADFAIVCEDNRYLVHRHILAQNSPYFERLFRFKGMETVENQVNLQDMDPFLVNHVLEFMYTGQYVLPGGVAIPAAGWCNHTSTALLDGPCTGPQMFKRKCMCSGKVLSSSHLLCHVAIYALADYFDMSILKRYARQGTEDVLHVHWAARNLRLGDALQEAFTSTPDKDRGLRDVMVGVLKDHPGLWVDEGDVHAWLHDHPEVMKEIEGE